MPNPAEYRDLSRTSENWPAWWHDLDAYVFYDASGMRSLSDGHLCHRQLRCEL